MKPLGHARCSRSDSLSGNRGRVFHEKAGGGGPRRELGRIASGTTPRTLAEPAISYDSSVAGDWTKQEGGL
jgi:hypothetical protein